MYVYMNIRMCVCVCVCVYTYINVKEELDSVLIFSDGKNFADKISLTLLNRCNGICGCKFLIEVVIGYPAVSKNRILSYAFYR